MDAQDRLDCALTSYERAVFGGTVDAVEEGDRALDAVDAALALARGRLAHARFLATGLDDRDERAHLERAVELFGRVGDRRGEGEALFWLATYHQVVLADPRVALPHLQRAEQLARAEDDRLTLSYVLRHLNFVAHAEGRVSEAESLLRESTDLRRGLGFDAGVAANLIGHAYLAAALGRPEEVPDLLDEAEALTTEADAAGVRRWVADARTELEDRQPG